MNGDCEVSRTPPIPVAGCPMSEQLRSQSLAKPIFWGVAVGIVQAFSPLGFWWLAPSLVWSLSVVIIASVYVGFAVADGRPRVLAVEVGVTFAFFMLATIAIVASPWLAVV